MNYTKNQNYGLEFMPTWIFTLANHIPQNAGLDLAFYDTRFDEISSIQSADVFLFSGINQDLDQLLIVRKKLKDQYPNALSIIGGPICWSFNEAGDLDLLQDFDHIFIGDGEDKIGQLLVDLSNGVKLEHIIRNPIRFDLNQSKPFYKPFLMEKFNQYYGTVIEVSRGCPFLCEFCDIRIMTDNNRAHNRPVEIIIEEMEFLIKNGKSQFVLACDNFIGDLVWAEKLVDEIILMVERIGIQPNLYTWLTINLSKLPRLLKKMRLAGFDLLFIGIESFNVNSLIETAKVQNTKRAIIDDIKTIQSYGFIIIAGLIFGFDTEEEDMFDVALEGFCASGLLSGDPNFLTALPGTPLYRRMQLSNRLRSTSDLSSSTSTGGAKHITNIKYLIPKDILIDGFKHFVRSYNQGKYQLKRLKIYFENLEVSQNYIPLKKGNDGFSSLGGALTILFKDKRGFQQLLNRLFSFCRKPTNLYYALLGLLFVVRKTKIKGRFNHFRFWLFAWSNYIMKYQDISSNDFDIDSVDENFDYNDIIPKGYGETAKEDIPQNKIDAQIKSTTKGLQSYIDKKKGKVSQT
ncbi:MAG: radical SAM protein [Chitinophagales bacterium]